MSSSPSRDARLDQLMERVAARPDTCDVSAAMSQPSTGWSWNWRAPAAPAQYFTASITKLYTTTVILQMVQERSLRLNTALVDVVGPDVVSGLHQRGTQDHSHAITIEQLLRHTSGLPDYFEDKRADGSTLFRSIIAEDHAWERKDALGWARDMAPRFAPGARGKAHYSDTNYQLLGMVAEAIDGRPYHRILHSRIIKPLGLTQTFLYTHDTRAQFPTLAGMKWGKSPLALPQAMGSFGPDGSLVSTAPESVAFLTAMMDCTLLEPATVRLLSQRWNRIFFPLEYGLGVMRFKMSRMLQPFPPPVEFIGHSGASGVVSFYAPAYDLYVSMAINQVKSRSLVYRVMSQATAAATKR